MSPAAPRTTDPVRRIAWVTYGLALACVAGFFFAKSAMLEADAAMAGQLASAEEYLREHPYLEAPPLLEERLPADEIARLKQRFQEARLRVSLSRLESGPLAYDSPQFLNVKHLAVFRTVAEGAGGRHHRIGQE